MPVPKKKGQRTNGRQKQKQKTRTKTRSKEDRKEGGKLANMTAITDIQRTRDSLGYMQVCSSKPAAAGRARQTCSATKDPTSTQHTKIPLMGGKKRCVRKAPSANPIHKLGICPLDWLWRPPRAAEERKPARSLRSPCAAGASGCGAATRSLLRSDRHFAALLRASAAAPGPGGPQLEVPWGRWPPARCTGGPDGPQLAVLPIRAILAICAIVARAAPPKTSQVKFASRRDETA